MASQPTMCRWENAPTTRELVRLTGALVDIYCASDTTGRPVAMLRFRQMKTLQKFASVHASISNHFNQERHLVDRQTYKQRRSAALAEWQSLMA